MSATRFSNFNIKKFRKEIEPQEVLLDSLAQKREKELGISEKKLESPISQKTIRGFFIIFLILIFILLARTFQFQILQAQTFKSLSEENSFFIHLIRAERGIIYDKDMNKLVSNKPRFNLIVQKQDLPQEESKKTKIFTEISQIIQMSYQDLIEKISQSNTARILVSENLNHQTLILLETRIGEFPGFELENNSVREYLSGPVFSHLIGYKRQTDEITGLEEYYDEILSPKLGAIQIERDVYGKPISKKIVALPESGNSLVLWLDSGLQKKLGEALESSIKEIGAQAGAAVAIDPQTGGVLALVSYPYFDNNLFSQGMSKTQWQEIQNDPNNPLFNRVISGIGYPTGSTIKPLIGGAALEEGIIKPDTKLYCPLEICVQNPWYPDKEDCYADWKYHGTSDLKRAIAESVNTFFYQVGGGYQDFKGLGAKKIKNWLEIFGWGRETGIDLPREGKGILPNLEQDWRLGDTYHFSIGQGPFSIPPLQVATAFMAIANGGKIFQPKVVKEIVDEKKNLVKEIEPKVLEEIPVTKENLEVVRQGMRQAVTSAESPANLLNSLPVAAAAKTGTAQTEKENFYHNWVTVFAPYDNPKIVLTIVIENVEGSKAAVLPVAKEVLDWYFTLDKHFQ